MSQARHYEMKDSGVEWIGTIPSHWGTLRLKFAAWLKGRIGWQGLKSNEYTDEGAYLITGTDFDKGRINWDTCAHITIERFNEDSDIHIQEGDLLITKDGTIGKVAITRDCPAMVSLNSGVMLIRNVREHKYHDKYLYYILNSNQFLKWYELSQNGASTIRHLYQEQFYNFCFSYPPLPEQAAIVAYLDEKCAAIDSIIAEAKATIEEYRAWKASVIFEAVTKGLNPNAEMKDSGVEWIGEMPKDWNIVRFKRMHRGSNVGLSLDKDYWSTNEDDTVFYTAGLKSIHTSYKDIEPDMLTKENDLLLARNGTPYVYFPSIGAIYTDHIIRVGIENGYNKAFVRYCLQQSIANEVVDTVSIATWSVPIWNRQCLPHPSLAEQTAISDYLDSKCAAIDAIIAEKEALISDLETYKKSLIFEVVTGKRRVC